MGRDLISVKEDYWKHDGNPQSESQVKLKAKEPKSKNWEEHITDSNAIKFEDWDDYKGTWFLPGQFDNLEYDENPAVHAQRVHKMIKLDLCIDYDTDNIANAVVDDNGMPPIKAAGYDGDDDNYFEDPRTASQDEVTSATAIEEDGDDDNYFEDLRTTSQDEDQAAIEDYEDDDDSNVSDGDDQTRQMDDQHKCYNDPFPKDSYNNHSSGSG